MPYNCKHCEQKFDDRFQLANHVRNEHKGTRCPECRRTFASAHGLKIHMSTTNHGAERASRNASANGTVRKVKKRRAKVDHAPARALMFCPCCGVNMQAVATALNAVGGA